MVRRRQAAVALIAGLSAVAGIVVGAGADGDPPAQQPVAEGPSCPSSAASDPGGVAGQLLIVRMEDEATDELLRAARRGEIAGVIVFPPETSEPGDLRPEIRRLQEAARRGGNPPLLVMVDQEGGGVKRFPLAPPQRSPVQLAEFGARRDARLEGQATGNFLTGLGIDVDLAPVLDVPTSDDVAIALRAFGSEPGRVARLGLAFAAGLADEGAIPVPKHFPGLGRAEVSTDAAPVTIDASERQLRSDLVPFRDAIARDVEMIMVGLAVYPAYDEDRPAALSPTVVDDLLRARLGFDGVAISDDLEAPAISAAGIEPGEAAVGAANAGVDLLLFAGEGNPHGALARALRRGRLDAESAEASCARVVALKEGLGPE